MNSKVVSSIIDRLDSNRGQIDYESNRRNFVLGFKREVFLVHLGRRALCSSIRVSVDTVAGNK